MRELLKRVRNRDLSNWSVSHLLASRFEYSREFKLERIGNFLIRNRTGVLIEDNKVYKRVTIRLYNKGVKLRDIEIGRNIGTKKQFVIREGQFLMSKIDARNGAFGIATKEIDGAVITADFFAYDIDQTKIIPQFLVLLTTTREFQSFAQSASSGTTGRQRMNEQRFLDVKVPLPTLLEQQLLLDVFNLKTERAVLESQLVLDKQFGVHRYLVSSLGVRDGVADHSGLLSIVRAAVVRSWSVKDLKATQTLQSDLYKVICFDDNESLLEEAFRGKSPVYDKKSQVTILNQKCIRWNRIEREHAKGVDKGWFAGIDRGLFTREGDILINSTGEGTIGRSSYVGADFAGLLYDSHVLLIRVNPNKVDALFLTFFLNSEMGQQQINSLKSAVATKQTELGIGNLKKIRMILPPLEIQRKIGIKLQRDFAEIEALSSSAVINRQQAIADFELKIFNQ